MHPNAWKTDDTLKVTHHYDQKEITTAWKLYGILSASLLLIALIVISLGTMTLCMKIDYQFCLATVITKVSERLEEEKQISLNLSMVLRIFLIDFLLLIILTIIYFTCFGCFFIVSGSTQQNITLSSSGLANETYPDSMGEYQPTEGGWYRHVDREDRFIIFAGKINL